MTTVRSKGKPKEDVHSFLCIEVNHFDVSSDASLNYALRDGRSLFSQSDDLAYKFVTTLTISGVCISPPGRTGESYEFTVLGEEPHAGRFSATLSDFQARDGRGILQYRSFRGEKFPVYNPPPDIGRFERNRGTDSWNALFWLHPRLVSDMLCLLTNVKPLYASLHERKTGRERWIQSFSLQSAKPDEG